MKKTRARQVLLAAAFAALAVAVQADDRFWVATDAGNWSDTANWSATSGGAGGATVPGSSDIAIFDGSGGANGNCAIDVNVNVGGIGITAGYSGEIAQGAQEVLVGTQYFTQAGGTYAGGTGELKVSAFRLDGGEFTAPSSLLEVGRLLSSGLATYFRFDPGAAIFEHNSGTVRFNVQTDGNGDRTYTIDLNEGEIALNHFEYTGGHYRSSVGQSLRMMTYNIANDDDTFVVEGDLLMAPSSDQNDFFRFRVNGGIHRLEGDLTLGNAVAPNPDNIRNGLQGGTTIVEFVDTEDQTFKHYTSHIRGPWISVNKSSGTVSAEEGFEDLSVQGLVMKQGSLVMAEDSTLTLQFMSGDGNTSCLFDIQGGTLDIENATLAFRATGGSGTSARTFDIKLNGGSLTVGRDMIIAGGNNGTASLTYAMGASTDTFVVLGDLFIGAESDLGVGRQCTVTSGNIEVRGNIVIGEEAEPDTGRGVRSGSTTNIRLTGSSNQTVTQHYPAINFAPGSHWTINKTGGTVALLSDVRLGRTNQDLLWTAGGLDLGVHTLTVNRNVTIGEAATRLGLTIADAGTAGNIVAGGNASQWQHVDLLVTVAGSRQIVDGQSYTILSNSTVVEPFSSVAWRPYYWSSIVNYDGTEVVLANVVYSHPGTVFRIR